MTTLTQHSPSLSSPRFPINGSSEPTDYFSIQIPSNKPALLPHKLHHHPHSSSQPGSSLSDEPHRFTFPSSDHVQLPSMKRDIHMAQANSSSQSFAGIRRMSSESPRDITPSGSQPAASSNSSNSQDSVLPSPTGSDKPKRSLSKKLKISEFPKKFINISQSLKSSSNDAENTAGPETQGSSLQPPSFSSSGSPISVDSSSSEPKAAFFDNNKPLPDIPSEPGNNSTASLTTPIKEFIKSSPSLIKGSGGSIRPSRRMPTVNRAHAEEKQAPPSASASSTLSQQDPFAMAFANSELDRRNSLRNPAAGNEVSLSSLSINETALPNPSSSSALYGRSKVPAYMVASNFNKSNMGQIPENEIVLSASSIPNRLCSNSGHSGHYHGRIASHNMNSASSLSNMSINSDFLGKRHGHEKASPSVGSIAFSSGSSIAGVPTGSASKDNLSLYRTTTNSSISSLPNMAHLKKKYQKNTNNLQDLEFDVPENATLLSSDAFANFLQNSVLKSDGEDASQLDNAYPYKNLIVIDIRSFNEYAKSRINNAINISLPTTLLRRANYTLPRTIQSLNNFEKGIFTNFLNKQEENMRKNRKFYNGEINGIPCGPYGLPAVLLYDAHSMVKGTDKCSLSVKCMVAKFLSNNSWNAPIFMLKGGFDEFAEKFPSMVDSNEPYKTTNYMRAKQQKQQFSLKLDLLPPADSKNDFVPTSLNLDGVQMPGSAPGSSQDFPRFNFSDHSKGPSHQRQQSSLTIDTSSINQASVNGSITSANSSSIDDKYSANSMLSNSSASSILSGFQLPAAKPFFRVRQNDEMINVDNCIDHIKLNNLKRLNERELSKLPRWFSNLLTTSAGAGTGETKQYGSRTLVEKFSTLEVSEKERLNKMLTVESYDNYANRTNNSQFGPDYMPRISGVEMGHKNRYKDILPFEDTRVVIPQNKNSCDYINASYLTSINCFPERFTAPSPASSSSTIATDTFQPTPNRGERTRAFDKRFFRYIATQGPLQNTIGDFWRMVYGHKCPIIISLTEERDGVVEKCANFWKSQVVHDNGTIKVQEIESIVYDSTNTRNFTKTTYDEEELASASAGAGSGGYKNNSIVIRRILVEIDGMAKHEVVQFQLRNWHDLGTFTNYDELLLVVFMKNCVLNKFRHWVLDGTLEVPIVVHCSAGCGRTGTFCSIDSTIGYELNHLDFYKHAADEADRYAAANAEEQTATPTPKVPQFNFDSGDVPPAQQRHSSNNSVNSLATINASKAAINFANTFDPVYENVSLFRKQRVSMVQTTRQYLLIYDTLLIFYKYQQSKKLGWFFMASEGIPLFERFFDDWKVIMESRTSNGDLL